MTKTELIKILRTETGVTNEVAANTINVIIDSIITAVTEGEKVTLQGFATFEKVERAARVGRNPKTGEEIQIPAKNVIKATMSKSIKID